MSPTVSISLIDTRDYCSAIYALQRTLKTLDNINITKIYWSSDIPCPIKLSIPVEWIKISKISASNWVYFCGIWCFRILPNHVTEDYNIIVHDDGYAVNKSAWTDEFFNYDYIGPTFPHWITSDVYGATKNPVGSGGFSIRSKKLYSAIKSINMPIDREDYYKELFLSEAANIWNCIPEDELICRFYYEKLTKEYDIKFAPIELADQWAIDKHMSSPWLGKSLGFHGRHGVATHYGEVLTSDRKKFNLV